jgi:hypothetical protein
MALALRREQEQLAKPYIWWRRAPPDQDCGRLVQGPVTASGRLVGRLGTVRTSLVVRQAGLASNAKAKCLARLAHTLLVSGMASFASLLLLDFLGLHFSATALATAF